MQELEGGSIREMLVKRLNQLKEWLEPSGGYDCRLTQNDLQSVCGVNPYSFLTRYFNHTAICIFSSTIKAGYDCTNFPRFHFMCCAILFTPVNAESFKHYVPFL